MLTMRQNVYKIFKFETDNTLNFAALKIAGVFSELFDKVAIAFISKASMFESQHVPKQCFYLLQCPS